MKDRLERMNEFVSYHINGDGECNNVVLKAYAEKQKLNSQERYELAFLFSVTYCVESAVILFENCFLDADLYGSHLTNIKRHILFQSDRKYMKMKDNFERSMRDFAENHRDLQAFLKIVADDGVINLQKAIKYVSTWTMYGRFASYLFLETFCELTGLRILNTTIEWKKGDTATSGLLNLYGFDEQADRFDKEGKLSFDTVTMDKMLQKTLFAISSAGGKTNVTEVETSLCAYRKFYKGSRYNGYYLDRMLEEIYAMRGKCPEVSQMLLDIRRECFDKRYLGEAGGWRGIRKELKRTYKDTGIIT